MSSVNKGDIVVPRRWRWLMNIFDNRGSVDYKELRMNKKYEIISLTSKGHYIIKNEFDEERVYHPSLFNSDQ